nr:Gag-Pol polyprotein [Tanacetum cinerariifolium]
MLNKENYVPWPSRLLQYAKSRPNGKLIHNSILNGPYVRRMIPEPGDANCEVIVTKPFMCKQMMNSLIRNSSRLKLMIKLFRPFFLVILKTSMLLLIVSEWSRHVTIVHQTKDLHTADYTQLYEFLNYNQKEVDELKAKQLAKTQDPLVLMENSNNLYVFLAPHHDQSSFNQNYLQQPMPNPEDITDPTTIAQPGMNMGQDRQMQMVGGNGGNQFRQYAGQNTGNLTGNWVIQNAFQNPRVQNVRNQNGLIDVQGNGNQNQIGNGVQLQAKEYDLMAAVADIDEIKEVNANCILMANLQQASTAGTQSDKAPVYDSDGSAELSKEKSTVSFLLEEKKKLKSDFKTREDELLDKQIQLEKRIKELNNILVKTGQSIQTIHMLSSKPDSFYHTEQKMALGYQNTFYLKQAQKKQKSLYNRNVLLEKPDPPVVHDSEETLQLAQESREKMKQLNKEIKPANYTKINHLSGVFVPQTAMSREELYFFK